MQTRISFLLNEALMLLSINNNNNNNQTANDFQVESGKFAQSTGTMYRKVKKKNMKKITWKNTNYSKHLN